MSWEQHNHPGADRLTRSTLIPDQLKHGYSKKINRCPCDSPPPGNSSSLHSPSAKHMCVCVCVCGGGVCVCVVVCVCVHTSLGGLISQVCVLLFDSVQRIV